MRKTILIVEDEAVPILAKAISTIKSFGYKLKEQAPV